jgi:hypothetical protein
VNKSLFCFYRDLLSGLSGSKKRVSKVSSTYSLRDLFCVWLLGLFL